MNDETMDVYARFEKKLTSVLKPVRPNPGYVDRLKHSLGTAPYTIVEKGDSANPLIMLLLGVGTALLAFLLLRRFRP